MNIRSLSVILISVAPRCPKHSVDPIPSWKQLIFSGTSGPISATIAKLCSSSSISSSLIVKNCVISYDGLLLAGTVIVVALLLKSATRQESYTRITYYSQFCSYILYCNNYTYTIAAIYSTTANDHAHRTLDKTHILLVVCCLTPCSSPDALA